MKEKWKKKNGKIEMKWDVIMFGNFADKEIVMEWVFASIPIEVLLINESEFNFLSNQKKKNGKMKKE